MKSLILFLIFSFFCLKISAQTITWTGAYDLFYSHAENWSPQQVPMANNDVIIPTGSEVHINVDAWIKSIVVQGNSSVYISHDFRFTHASSIEENATVNWSSSSLTGGGTLTNYGTIILSGSGVRYISEENTTLINKGSIQFPSGGQLRLYSNAFLDNQAAGVIDIQQDCTIANNGDTHNFTNSGLLKKTGGDNVAYISCKFTNTGAISVEHGTLTLNGLTKNFDGGVYNVSAGCWLIFNTQINMQDELTGVLDGPMNWADDVSVADAATFNFTGASGVTWTSNSLIGGGTLTNASTIILNSATGRYISGEGTKLINTGSIQFPLGGGLNLYDSAILDNQASGVIDIQEDSSIGNNGGDHNFINTGLIKKTGGENVAYISCLLNNTGTISVEHGTLTLNGLDKTFDGGVYNVSAGCWLIFNTQINMQDELTGVLDGPMNWADDVSVADAATFNFTGASGVTWTSNSLIGGGTLTNASTIILNSATGRYISGEGTKLINAGSIQFPLGGGLNLYDSAILDNQASGVIDIQEDSSIGNNGGDHNFINTGLIKKTGGENVAYISCLLNNTGTISVEHGTLTLNGLTKNFDGGVYNVSADCWLIFNTQINMQGELTGVLDGPMNWADDVSVADAATFNFTGASGVTWTSNSLIGGGTLTNASTIILNSNGVRKISGQNTKLINTGSILFPLGGQLNLYDNAILDNQASGVIDIQEDSTIGNNGGDHNFTNEGLIKKTGGENVAYISCLLNNTGTISVEHGTLTMKNQPKTFDGGVYNVSSDCWLIFNSQINMIGELTGVLDGPMNWAGDVSVADAASFNFTGNSGVTWTSNSLIGGGTLTNESTIILNSNGVRYISGQDTKLVNRGSILFPLGGQLNFYDNATLDNQTSGVIDIQEDSSIGYNGSGALSIINSGLIKKSGGLNTAYIHPPVTNSGTIEVSSGELEFTDTFGLTNTVDGIIQGTATIDLPSAANFTNDGTFSPGGEPGTLTVVGDFKSSATSNLRIELYGYTPETEYDLLAIQGNAIMDGDIPVALYFAPNIDDEFIILTANTITSCNLPATVSSDFDGYTYTFDVICNPDNVTLKVTDIALGVEENTLSNLSLYPNPSNGNFTIDLGKEYAGVTVEISNIVGQTISKRKIAFAKNIQQEIDGPAGIYFVKISTGDNKAGTLKLIKR